MITIIFGLPGAGKTALNTYFLKKEYEESRYTLLNDTRRRIEEINRKEGRSFALPIKPPIYADYDVKLHVAYKKYFEPFHANGYYFGFNNDRMETQFLLPGSRVHFSEVQKYFNSRKSQTLPEHLSHGYEMHRHNGLQFYMDVQRVRLIDLNVREISGHFIEVLKMEHVKDEVDNIWSSTFHCREFKSWIDVETYLNTGAKLYDETTYYNDGCIFDEYDSFSCGELFVPPKGKTYSMLPSRAQAKALGIESEFYSNDEPKGYRSK